MEISLKIIYLFLFFSIIGWAIEVTFRSIIAKHFVNPGFMVGITLPIYGIGGLALTLIGEIVDLMHGNYKYIVFFLLAVLIMTIIEYIDGYIFMKYFNIKLWDYSRNKFNYKGLICLTFSIAWGVLGLIFYITIYQQLNSIVYFFFDNKYFLFFLGIFWGLFLIDLIYSFNLFHLIKKYSYLTKKTINIEELKIKLLSKKVYFLPNLELKKVLMKKAIK